MADIDISTAHNEYRLEGTLAYLTLGPNPPKLLILDGTRPSPGGAATTILATIILSDPPGTVTSGALPITAANPSTLVMNSGSATWARFINGNGAWAIDCRVSNAAGDAPVKISDTTLLAGGSVSLISAVLG